MDIAGWMAAFSDYVWSTPVALLLTGAGVLFTIMTLGIQFKALTHGLAVIRGKYDNPDDAGNISHFQALCAALSATIGLGNISGVAVGLAAGGPGAVFWMWIVGFLGMATKFTTCSLATMYRKRDRFGEYRGGPMYYIEMGLGQNATTLGMKSLAKGLAVLFAILGMSASVGAGNMFQANQVASIVANLAKHVSEQGVTPRVEFWIRMAVGAGLFISAALVMIGGIRRIGSVASKVVPSMCIVYVTGALIIICKNIDLVPEIFASIFEGAFSASAGTGAFYGVAVRTAMIQGIRRACFSNEAGLGSAPIAHATAKTNEPIREGVVAAVGPFVDTIVICTMTALVIMITGTLGRGPVAQVARQCLVKTVLSQDQTKARTTLEVELAVLDDGVAKVGEQLFVHWPQADPAGGDNHLLMVVDRIDGETMVATATADDEDTAAAAAGLLVAGQDVFLFREGVQMTAFAFDRGLGGFGTYFIPIAALFFAFSTIVSWGFYGETCTEYLFGERAVMPFKYIFVSMILVGTASMRLEPVLDWSDGMLGLMLVPNLIGTLLLAPVVMRETRIYFNRLYSGEFKEEMERAAEARRASHDER